SEKSEETALVDSVWPMGWLRYGEGDWRTGWPASLLGDLIVRTEDSIFTIFSNDGAWRLRSDGSRQKYPLLHQPPFRMAARADSRFCAFGFLVPDVRELDDKTRQKLHLPPALLTVSNAATSEKLWQVRALEVRRVPKPPEPADAFPDMAEDFNMKALTLAPFR